MKSINDIILTNAISAYLDESIIKHIENLKDYHIKIYNKYIKKTN